MLHLGPDSRWQRLALLALLLQLLGTHTSCLSTRGDGALGPDPAPCSRESKSEGKGQARAQDYDYFAVHLTGLEPPSSSVEGASLHARSRHRRRQAEALEHRAQLLAAETGFLYIGPVGELVDYFLFAVPHGLPDAPLPRTLGHGHSPALPITARPSLASRSPAFSSSSSSARVQHISAHPDVRWVGHQVPTRRLFKRAAVPPLPSPLAMPPPSCGSTNAPESRRVAGNRTLLAVRAAPPGLEEELGRFQRTFDIKDPRFGDQWHLLNRNTAGNDLNLTGVWAQGFHGNGSTVCFLDDGIDYEHPDLKEAFHAAASYDFNDHRDLPTPTLFDDNHGTRCAGEVAARRNEVCGVGVAWEARVSAVRILSGTLSEADEAAAINYKFHENHIYSCSWGPPDNGKAMDAPPRIAQDAFRNGIEHGREGRGSIFVFAAGNGGTVGDNCNFDGYTNSIYSITIGAIDEFNRHPPYSERCASMLAVQYSSGHRARAIATTDWRNGCSNVHGGTSAAAPLVSGILAIVLGIRPDFTWRDVQYITLHGAVPFSLDDQGWQRAAQGRRYHPDFGFGRIDAYRTVEAAKRWVLVAPHTKVATSKVAVNQPIPQGSTGLSSGVVVEARDVEAARLRALEHVAVTFTLRHQRRGDCSFRLISPSGISSLLADARREDDDKSGFQDWTFTSVVQWGDEPRGTWTFVVVDDVNPDRTGTLESWYLTLYGATSPPPFEQPEPEAGPASVAPVIPINPRQPTSLAPPSSTPVDRVSLNDSSPLQPVRTRPRQSPATMDVWVVGLVSLLSAAALIGFALFSACIRHRPGYGSPSEQAIPLGELEEGRAVFAEAEEANPLL